MKDGCRSEVPNGPRVTAGIDRYIERFGSGVKQSVQYRILLLKRVKLLIGKQAFDGLTTATISKLTDDLRKALKTGSKSPNTVKRIHSDLRNFFRWSVEEGLLKEVPKFPRINSEKSRRPHFKETEWRKLVRYLREFVKIENRKTRRDRNLSGIIFVNRNGLRWRNCP